MKYLVCILILMFTTPAFAGDGSSAFSGAHGLLEDESIVEREPAATQPSPVVEKEPEFKIDERLYAESIGSNNGYYGGGYYGEERYAAQIDYFTITSSHRDFGFGTGFIVVDDQIVSVNLASPFLAFPFIDSGIVRGGVVGLNIGNFTIFRGSGFRHGGFGHGSFGFGGGSFGFGHRHR